MAFIAFVDAIPSLSTLLLSSIIIGVLWTAWSVFKPLLRPSPLDNLPGPKSTSIITGNLSQFFDRHGWSFLQECEEHYGGIVKINGMFGNHQIFVRDPLAIYKILLKDTETFDKAPFVMKSTNLIFGRGLLAVHGVEQRKQRKLLNPVFNINHMRHITPIFYNIAHKLRECLESQVKSGPKDIDMLHWTGRTALELIGQGGLGYSFDPLLIEEKGNPFGDALKSLLPNLFYVENLRILLPHVIDVGTAKFRRWVVDHFPNIYVQKVKDIVDIMHYESSEIYRSKKTALMAGDNAVVQQVGEGKDIMSILLKANMEASEEDRLSEDELLGQMSTLVFAATDTTSTALVKTLQILADHLQWQDKVRQELKDAQTSWNGDDIPHDEIMALPILDAICRETLRLYPPVNSFVRQSSKDGVLPLSEPIRGLDGTWMKEVIVPKDTMIHVGSRAVNRSKAIWGEDAIEWNPDRWLSPLPASVTDARIPGLYSNLLTFGGGVYGCVGFKFSQLEMKVVLATILPSFKFHPATNSKDIVWNFANVMYPSIGKTSVKPECPIKVELFKDHGQATSFRHS